MIQYKGGIPIFIGIAPELNKKQMVTKKIKSLASNSLNKNNLESGQSY